MGITTQQKEHIRHIKRCGNKTKMRRQKMSHNRSSTVSILISSSSSSSSLLSFRSMLSVVMVVIIYLNVLLVRDAEAMSIQSTRREEERSSASPPSSSSMRIISNYNHVSIKSLLLEDDDLLSSLSPTITMSPTATPYPTSESTPGPSQEQTEASFNSTDNDNDDDDFVDEVPTISPTEGNQDDAPSPEPTTKIISGPTTSPSEEEVDDDDDEVPTTSPTEGNEDDEASQEPTNTITSDPTPAAVVKPSDSPTNPRGLQELRDGDTMNGTDDDDDDFSSVYMLPSDTPSFSSNSSEFPSISPSPSTQQPTSNGDGGGDGDDGDEKLTEEPANFPSMPDLTNLPTLPLPTNLPTRIPTIIPTKDPTDNNPSDFINPLTLIPNGIDDNDDIFFQPGPIDDLSDRLDFTSSPTETGTNFTNSSIPTSAPSEIPIIQPTEVPTPRPTSFPTTPPVPIPTAPPTALPTRRPTSPPTLFPTTKPTETPTPRPTRFPTRFPTTPPTPSPTRSPTGRPSVDPTAAPIPNTLSPSLRPSARPTPQPTPEPTIEPSNWPSSRPTLVKSQDPTPSGTLEPSISPYPSTSPTVSYQPTDLPTKRPSDAPSVPPSQEPSPSPFFAPTLALQTETVKKAQMELYPFPDETLDGEDVIVWKSATEAHITQYLLSEADPPMMEVVALTVNIIEQSKEKDRRSLQRLGGGDSLWIYFNVSMAYRSNSDDYDTDELVWSAFASQVDGLEYIIALRKKSETFDPVRLAQVNVQGYNAPPTQAPQPAKEKRDRTEIAVIVGASIGGAALIILIILLFLRCSSGKTVSEKHREEIAETGASPSTNSRNVKVSTEILVEPQDDVSTLGDPMWGQGGMIMGGMDKDEVTASVGDDYDYTKQYRNIRDPLSIAGTTNTRDRNFSEDMSKMSSVQSTSMSKLEKMGGNLFADDASFEEQFSDPEERFDVVAPAGKLGMVIDTPNGGIPVVHAIKDTSVLSDQVRVGDRLLSVDGEDCMGMTAMQVSKLISLKSEKPVRVLVFTRSAANNNQPQ